MVISSPMQPKSQNTALVIITATITMQFQSQCSTNHNTVHLYTEQSTKTPLPSSFLTMAASPTQPLSYTATIIYSHTQIQSPSYTATIIYGVNHKYGHNQNTATIRIRPKSQYGHNINKATTTAVPTADIS